MFVTFGGIVVAPGLFGLLLALNLGYTSGFVMLALMALTGTAMALKKD